MNFKASASIEKDNVGSSPPSLWGVCYGSVCSFPNHDSCFSVLCCQAKKRTFPCEQRGQESHGLELIHRDTETECSALNIVYLITGAKY